jgi:hypothetical protein
LSIVFQIHRPLSYQGFRLEERAVLTGIISETEYTEAGLYQDVLSIVDQPIITDDGIAAP